MMARTRARPDVRVKNASPITEPRQRPVVHLPPFLSCFSVRNKAPIDRASKNNSEYTPLLRTTVLQLNAVSPRTSKACGGVAYPHRVRYSHTKIRDTKPARTDRTIIYGRFSGKLGLSFHTSDSSKGYRGGDFVSTGSPGRL